MIDESFEADRQILGKDFFLTSIDPFIVGCVTYRSTFDATIHKTPFRVHLVMMDPKIIDNHLPLETRIGTIAMKSIIVKAETSFGGIRAD